MADVNLSRRDVHVLEKMRDPESNPAAAVVIDASLPRDPRVADSGVYESLVQRERAVIQSVQSIEAQLSQSRAQDADDITIQGLRRCMSRLDGLISEQPEYTSARNNRAQVIRRLYGDSMLLDTTTGEPVALVAQPDPSERRSAAVTALEDLDRSIALLSPPEPHSPVSSQAARTLSMAHTQRAAIYLCTSKLLPDRRLDLDQSRPEARWAKLDFEEAAARDLACGGWYGNQVVKGLAVSVNPTAKLCGQIVREAMKKEYGPSFQV